MVIASLALSGASRAHAQGSAPVGLELPNCARGWADFETLAPLLRVELRALGVPLDVEPAGLQSTIVAVRADCALADPASALVLEVRRDGAPARVRAVSLSDVDGDTRARTLAMVLADLVRAPDEPPPPVVEAAREAPVEPPPRHAPPPLAPHARDALGDPSAMPVEDQAHPIELALGALLSWSPRDAHALAGGELELTVLATRTADWALRTVLGASLLVASRALDVGAIDLVWSRLALGLELSVVLGALELGARALMHPGVGVSVGRTTVAGLSARTTVDATIDGALGAHARVWIDARFFVRIDVGIEHVARGIEAQYAGARVLGLGEWAIPLRLAIGVSP